MKFEEKYPNAQHGDKVRLGILKLNKFGESPCCICKEPTSFHEVNYECPLCSEECLAKMDKGYMEASRGVKGQEVKDSADSHRVA